MVCKICNNDTYDILDLQFNIVYNRCKVCGFIYENPKHHVDHHTEKEEYKTHNNSLEDDGYVQMFKRFQRAFEPYVTGKEVLEYGSGPEPVFSELLKRDGYHVTSYDPFFLPDTTYLLKKYDLITSTEVFEHFFEPIEEINKLVGLLNPNGILAIMTQFPKDDEHFKTWWYRRDVTHVSFYTLKSFEVIGEKFNLEIVYNNDKDYVIYKNVKSAF